MENKTPCASLAAFLGGLLGLLICADQTWAIDSTGRFDFYKGATSSSHSHAMIVGAAAADLFSHLAKAPQTEDRTQGIIIRAGKSLECVHFYKDAGQPHRCYLHMDEAGLILPGYAPK